MNLEKFLHGDNLKYLLGAAVLGAGAAYMMSKNKNYSSNYVIPSNIVQNNLNTPSRRSFHNLSDEVRWNSLPLIDVEVNVPFDTLDRFATVQGSYGQDYSYVGVPH